MDIFDLIFPKKCINCGKGEKYICSNCLGLVHLARLSCPVCGRSSIDGMAHFKCKTKFGIDGLISLWRYEGVIRKSILALKYKFAKEVADELVEISLSRLLSTSYNLHSTIFVPVPIHAFRENWRGFNQSEVLGKSLSRGLGIKFIPDLLIKYKSTVSQTEILSKERSKNVDGVFKLNPKYLRSNIKDLVLFDDVWTTGSTLKEASKVLKRAGVETIWGLTIAS